MPENEVDVAILGSGPVGCALSLALRGSGLKVALYGRPAALAPASTDARTAFRPLAMSYASRLILERAGAWEGLDGTPIKEVHVSQAGGFGRTRLSREDAGLPALGYVMDYSEVAAHLLSLAAGDLREAVTPDAPRARLTVHAEGFSLENVAAKDYGHTAIVAEVQCEPPSHGTAWERFTPDGPLALLPGKRGYGLVWTRPNDSAASLMAAGDGEFLAQLQSAFGRRAGTFTAVGARSAMPLVLRYRKAVPKPGEVHVGNAAQTLHPVAGQGLNLGLRDAWELACLLRTTPREQLGVPAFSRTFARGRRVDARATIHATDLMATLFVRRDPISSAIRGLALTALDIFPPARKIFARRMIYGASAW